MTSLRVASFTVTPTGGRLDAAVGHRGWTERRGLALRLRDDRGREGRGEAAPLDLEELARARSALDLVLPRLGRVDLREPPRTAVARVVTEAKQTGELPSSATWALETALFDLVGQCLGQSVAECLRPEGPAYDDVEVNGLLSSTEPSRCLTEVEALHRRGIRAAKMKIGPGLEAFDDACRALEAIRDAWPGMRLRLDANGGWSVPHARQRLEALARFEPELCEQPTSPETIAELGPTAVPWFADESFDAHSDPAAVLGLAGLGGVVIKPPRVGGLLAALKIAEEAQARDLPVVVTHSFDGAIGLAAACELALALPQRPRASGLDRHAALSVFPPCAIPQRRVEDRVLPSGRSGLGVEPPC